MPFDATFAIGLSVGAGALAYSAPAEVGITIGIVLVATVCLSSVRPSLSRATGWTLGPRLLALVCALAFAFSAFRTQRVIRRFENARISISTDRRWPSRCQVEGRVATSPARTMDVVRVDVDVERAECERGALQGQEGLVGLYVPVDAPALSRGDHVKVVASLAPGYRFWNDGAADPAPSQAHRGAILSGGAEDVIVTKRTHSLPSYIDRAREIVRRRILATFPPETEGMARALVLGESALDEADQNAFRQSGLSHLLAVSGMHLVLVVASFVAGLRALLLRWQALAVRYDVHRIAAAIGIPAAFFYADFAGASGSAMRAAWMSAVALLARALARKPDTWRAFGLSMVGMELFDPLTAYDLSFLLSAAATLGLLALGPPITRALEARLPSWATFITRPLAATTAASVACSPVLACMAPELPIAGLVANLVAVPLGELAALPLCLVHAVLSPVPAAERGTALAASGALGLVRIVARRFSAFSWGMVAVPLPTAAELCALAVFALGLGVLAGRSVHYARACNSWIVRNKRIAWIVGNAALLIVLELAARAAGSSPGALRVTFADVGQGDAALVDFPDGRLMLIDGGGLVGSPIDMGQRVIAPLLRARRRTSIDVVVLTHPHPDHFGGLRTGLRGVDVGEFWDTGQGESEDLKGEYAELLSSMRARGVPIRRPQDVCGLHTFGNAVVEVLAPCASDPRENDRGPNDNSFVFRIRYGARAFLFVGDAERAEEYELVDLARGKLHADVLKVGHHGSRTSSTKEMLEAVSPRAAIISCGVRNRFGHPHPNTLLGLARAGITTYRTDHDGSVMAWTDGRTLDVQSLSTMPMYGRFRYFSATSSP
ncbi:MAG: DNA internalization-related competence protein ComEC/Rec2 [Polyangiaceae bacterium]|nr:DNA internalization-related competence protein ComEC/Rec2 [Polyangiaceae bacterium]